MKGKYEMELEEMTTYTMILQRRKLSYDSTKEEQRSALRWNFNQSRTKCSHSTGCSAVVTELNTKKILSVAKFTQ